MNFRKATVIVVSIVLAGILALSGCSTEPTRLPQTAEEGWQIATQRNSVREYERFLERHPNSQFDEQAKDMLAIAKKRQEERQLEIQTKAKDVQKKGGKTWELVNKETGTTILVYRGMTVQELRELGIPITALIPRDMEHYDTNVRNPVTGELWIFRSGSLEDVRK